jgi:hypothetical protein
MTAARIRLLVAFIVFAAWVGWLGFQSLSEVKDPVISRAQLLVSTIDIVANVQAESDGRPSKTATVEKVHWPNDGGGLKLGAPIQVTNLPESTGFGQPGAYILPLVVGDKPGEYRIAGLPPSPGFDTFGQTLLFIYPLTAATQKQVDAIPKR